MKYLRNMNSIILYPINNNNNYYNNDDYDGNEN